MCVVYVTQGLVEVLLRLSRERDPQALSIPLAVTEAGRLGDTDLDDDTPVFTHFYLPDTGRSLGAVFGVDLGIPAGQTQGRFVSHPHGDLSITKRDDLHEVVFVAIPPWDEDSIGVFDRTGTRGSLTVVDAEPPTEFPSL
jgi:hypothetical protein